MSALRGVSVVVPIEVWDTANNTGRTGDAANITLQVVKDGGTPANTTNSITEESNGTYSVVLTASEMDASNVVVNGSSTTADTSVRPSMLYPLDVSAFATALTSNATWQAAVQAEANDALVANNLDHLCLTATAAADMTTEVADGTILSRILANGDTSVFDPSTDGLQPIRDQGDAAWTTATNANIKAQVDQALVDINLDHLLAVATVGADMTAEVVDNSVVARMLSNGDTSAFDPSTDGLQPVRDQLATLDAIVDAIVAGTNPVTVGAVDTAGGNAIADAILLRKLQDIETSINGTHGHTLAVAILQGTSSQVDATGDNMSIFRPSDHSTLILTIDTSADTNGNLNKAFSTIA